MSVRTRWWAAAAAAALVAVVAIVVAAQGPPAPDATTTTAVAPAPVPAEPQGVAWTWQIPGSGSAQDDLSSGDDSSGDDSSGDDEEGPSVEEAVAAGAGVVVMTDDGAIALDGRTGKERWHYRPAGGTTTGLLASPRGGWVTLAYVDDDDTRHLVALDAMTGRPGMRFTPSGGEGNVWMTADGVLVSDQGTVTSGHDIRTGERLWSYRLPKGCLTSPRKVDDRSAVVRDAVVLGTVCAPASAGSGVIGTLRVLALDVRTGEQRWSHDEAVPREKSSGLAWAYRELELESSPDGRFVTIKRWDDTLLDATSGKVLLDPEAMSEGEVREYGTDWVVVGHYTGEGDKRRYRTVRIDLGDGSRTTVRHPLLRPGSLGSATTLAGDRMLGLSEMRSLDETEETEDEVERVLRVVEGKPLRPVELKLGSSTDEDGDDPAQCGSDLLVAAPGAIVAGCTGTSRLVGIS